MISGSSTLIILTFGYQLKGKYELTRHTLLKLVKFQPQVKVEGIHKFLSIEH